MIFDRKKAYWQKIKKFGIYINVCHIKKSSDYIQIICLHMNFIKEKCVKNFCHCQGDGKIQIHLDTRTTTRDLFANINLYRSHCI